MASETRKIMVRLERATERAVKDLMLGITSDLIAETPVDTGWARANWVPGVGAHPEAPVGTAENVDRGEQNRGQIELAGYKFGQRAFTVNNVPYIDILNAGHSPQAQAGFVDAAVDRNVARVNRQKLR